MTDPLLTELARYTSDIVGREQLEERLAASAKDGRKLRVKFGIDPTFTDVHLGHAVPIRVLRLFQEHGHLPVLLLGDGTARLGDPTGRNDQRPPLTKEEVEANAETYLDQIGQLLDLSPEVCEVRRNSEWFSSWDFFDALKLAAHATAARMLERDDFRKRMDQDLPVYLHEMMYPVMQGWDSVELHADVELGGNDQLFNLHMGRLLQEREGQAPQVCITTPLLLGTDGRKMSKTYGNHVPLSASPDDIYGKVMSLSDEGMRDWFLLATRIPADEIDGLLSGHPREAKDRLAREVTGQLHGSDAAAVAAEEFLRRFRSKERPTEVPTVSVEGRGWALPALLKEAGLASSTSEARRLIQGGGVRIDGEVMQDVHMEVQIDATPLLLQAGKRRFAEVSAATAG